MLISLIKLRKPFPRFVRSQSTSLVDMFKNRPSKTRRYDNTEINEHFSLKEYMKMKNNNIHYYAEHFSNNPIVLSILYTHMGIMNSAIIAGTGIGTLFTCATTFVMMPFSLFFVDMFLISIPFCVKMGANLYPLWIYMYFSA